MTARTAQVADYARVVDILDEHPVESCAIGAWLMAEGPHALRRAEVWIYGDAVCYSGANLLPVNADSAAVVAFANRAIRQGRRCSSIVGRLPTTRELWSHIQPYWDRPRAIRDRQFVMVSDTAPPPPAMEVPVRVAQASDFDQFYAASIEMYIEEIEASPIGSDGGNSYRWRVSDLISKKYAYVWTERNEVIFKAEFGAVTEACAQLQGVWVHPDHRGRGIGSAGTAKVLQLAREQGIGRVSLAVNDYNVAALYAYERCGFRHDAEQLVVLF